MNLYNDASLAMIPSAVKDGKLYSIRPTDGSGDFTFSRGSNLAATRVDVNGLIEKGRENLFLQSPYLGNVVWGRNGTSITSGQSGYDGTSNAYKLTADGSTGSHYINQNLSTTGVTTASVYAKADGYNFLFIYRESRNTGYYYNLATGELGSPYAGGDIDATITSVGNGWYRCAFTFNHSGTSDVTFFIGDSDNNFTFTGDGTSGILLQHPQLESSLVATDYIETGASTAQAGITEDLPRLDYSGGASCPSLLLEPTRTNLVPQSEYILNGYYTVTSGTIITTNYGTSPEGLDNSSRLDSSNANGGWYTSGMSVSSGETYTCSIFAKLVSGSESDIVRFGFSLNGDKLSHYDISDGTINYSHPNLTTSIEDYGNGWYRLIQTLTTTSSGTLRQVFYSHNAAGDYEIYGNQVESNASYVSSYIPTYGSAVTRSEDSCSKTSATSLIGQSEGSFYIEINIDKLSLENRFILTLSNLAQSEGFFVRHRSSNELQFYSFGLTNNFDFRDSIISGGTYKLAGAYKSGDIVFYVNGVQINTDTTIFSTPDLSVIRLGRSLSSATSLGGGINQALLFKTRLTNGELQALTQ